MKNIEVSKIIDPIPASDGAGVKLKRSIGVNPNYFDPFLMLDEFGSENKDDYIGGFPPHPHRGIETVTYMLTGEFEHEDSTGAKGRMSAGDVQWMKTGGGVFGYNAVWVNRLNKVFDKLSYQPKFVIGDLKELLKII